MILKRISLYRLCFLIITLFSLHNLRSQDEVNTTLENIWISSHPPTVRVKKIDSICQKIDAVYSNSPFKYLHRALDLATENRLKEWIPRIELSLGAAYRRIDDNPPAEKYLLSALDKIEKLNDPELLSRAYNDVSYYFLYLPDYDETLRYLHLAIELNSELGLNAELGIMYGRLGELMQSTGHHDQVLPNLLKAQALLSESDQKYDLGINYHRLSDYYISIRDYEMAENALDKCVEALIMTTDQNSRNTIGYSHRGDFYLKLGQYEKAENDFNKLYQESVMLNDTLMIGTSCSKLSLLYASTQKLDSALSYLDRTKAFIKKDSVQKADGQKGIFIPVDLEILYSELSNSYRLLGDHENAYRYLLQLKSTQDSLFTQESNRTLIEMQTKYETEKKEMELVQKQQESYLFMALFAVLSLLFLLAVIAYNNKRKQNNLLQESNKQKTFFIKEIHHRVKNNLQILSSLLNLQTKYIKDPHAMDAVTEGRNRVQSMGLIHQKLYMGDELATVDMDEYINEMMAHLVDSFGVDEKVDFDVDVTIPLLDVDTAIPLGMIINELGTNSLKYAFDGDKKGLIAIKLWINEEEELCISVRDNGNGELSIIDQSKSTSFGTDLIKILSTKMKGEVKTEASDQGYFTLIRCKEYKVAS